MARQGDRLAAELAIVGDSFVMEHVAEVLKLDIEELSTVLCNAQAAQDFAFFLDTGFAIGRLYERLKKLN